jgi:O-methyltransferase
MAPSWLRRSRDRAPAADTVSEESPGLPPYQVHLLERADPADRAIIERCLHVSMTGVPRLQAVIDAVRYIVAREIPGGLAECGVWRGGSVMAMALTLQDIGSTDRHLWLYDTFEGMTEPTEDDVSPYHPPALETWQRAETSGERAWGELFDPGDVGEAAVRDRVLSTGYPSELVHIVKGPVEDTIPGQAPDGLALLRLDTDWYESTRHELVHLYPRLAANGVLIIDDFGHWDGARRAVEEYFEAHPPAPLLQRTDYAGRMAIKS